ncbi:MAG: TonB-dependent receptor plug domain-containing protein, partial [Tsuneonella sp.]
MKRAMTIAMLAGATALSGGQALAQDTSASGGEPDASAPAPTGEIIVTAERRAQRLIDVPLSISAVTGDDLARLNATQLRDYANTIPALTINSNGGLGQNQLTIRGVTSGQDVASTVGIYVDDVPYGGSTVFTINTSLALDAGLFDLDRIEVLRGPQGTLYGASSMGGLLKYVPRKPDLTDFQVAGQGGVSFTEHGGTNFNLAAAVNAPVVEGKVGVRASGFYTRDGGYIDDLGLGEANVGRGRLYGGRLDALFQATDNLSIRLTGFAQ